MQRLETARGGRCVFRELQRKPGTLFREGAKRTKQLLGESHWGHPGDARREITRPKPDTRKLSESENTHDGK